MRYLSASDLTEYSALLAGFRDQHSLQDLFAGEIDHLAMKLPDTEGYEQFLKEVKEHAVHGSEAELNGRCIATVELKKAITLSTGAGEARYIFFKNYLRGQPAPFPNQIIWKRLKLNFWISM